MKLPTGTPGDFDAFLGHLVGVKDHDAKREPIFRDWLIVAGTPKPGMVVEVMPVKPYFLMSTKRWHYRRVAGMKNRVYEVVSFGPREDNKSRANWLVGRRVHNPNKPHKPKGAAP